MKYRQWKKNYKKQHGVNPPFELDKRKQHRLAKKTVKKIGAIDWCDTLRKAANTATKVMADFMRAIGNGFDTAGTVCRNVADNIEPLEIKGCGLTWEVKPVVCDYGVYENCKLDGSSELKLITNSRQAAEKIVEIMQKDQLEHIKLNYPERIQERKREDVVDSLRAAIITEYESGVLVSD